MTISTGVILRTVLGMVMIGGISTALLKELLGDSFGGIVTAAISHERAQGQS